MHHNGFARVLGLLAAVLALCCGLARAAPFAVIANISNGVNPGFIQMVDLATNTVVATVDVGTALEAVAVEKAGRFAWIADRVGDVYKFDVITRAVVVGPIDVGGSNLPMGIAVDPSAAFVYVANQDAGEVAVIDTATNTVVANIPVGSFPHGIAVDPTGTWVYVTNEADDTLSVISTATNTVVATIPVGADPVGVAFNPSGTRAYVANNIDDTVSVIDVATQAVMGSPIATAAGPYGAVVAPDGKHLYITNCCANQVQEIDIQADANTITDTLDVGDTPTGISIDPYSRKVVAINIDQPSLSIIDTSVAPKTIVDLPMSVLVNTSLGMFITAGPPDPPTAASATAGNAQATVTFTPPALDGGSPITGYDVTSNPAGGVDSNAGSTSTSHVITGLANGTTYTFTVTATNLFGTSASSGASNAVTPATVPGAPTAVTATAGNAQATVSFTAPASTGGSAITGYTVASNPAGGVDSNAGSTSTTHVVTGLTNGTLYTFTVTATNAIGTGAPSAASNAVTPTPAPTAPGAPTAAAATAGNAQATVTFAAPASTGGSPITGYTVTSSPPGGVDSNAGSTSTTHVVTGLANGTAYTFTVRATNAIGTGPASSASNSITPRNSGSFTGPTATGTGAATVAFTTNDPGCAFAPFGTGPLQSAFFIPLIGSPKSPPAGSAPEGVLFPQGLLDFVMLGCAPGASVAFTVTYPSAIPSNTQYWKYGPTTSNTAPHWYTLPAAIAGNVIQFTIVDGGLGDDDLAANGTIVDQGGPGVGNGLQSIPTLSEWGLALLALLMLLTARRSRRARA